MDKHQLRDLIRRVLKDSNLWSPEAEELLMLTAAVESNLGQYIKQIKGPAKGIFQMEPTTERDIQENYLLYQEEFNWYIDELGGYTRLDSDLYPLEHNLAYQILMARVHYLRVPTPLPKAYYLYQGDKKTPHPMWIKELAKYWKDHYNTHLGSGTVEKAVAKYNRYVG